MTSEILIAPSILAADFARLGRASRSLASGDPRARQEGRSQPLPPRNRTVNPGFGGQAFIESQLEKIRRVRSIIRARPIRLEVDVGITRDNAAAIAAAGADTLVAGSAVFRGKSNPDYAANIAAIRIAAEGGRVPHVQDSSAMRMRVSDGVRIG